jgi:FtsP/CotA-like multicopper oxidase with cupredoxin domain
VFLERVAAGKVNLSVSTEAPTGEKLRNARGSLMIFLLGILSVAPGPVQPAQAQDIRPAVAIVYNLYSTDGYIELADGSAVYNFGFVGGRLGAPLTYERSFCTGDGDSRNCATPINLSIASGAPSPAAGQWTADDALLAGNAQFPAPVIYAAVGDVVEIRLKNLGAAANPNAPNDPHSIHLHGLDVNAANDGVPETSVGAVPANLCNDGETDNTLPADCADNGGLVPGAGNVIVYMFTPTKAGTYMYHCHQEADIHVNMGMYGALVVYNRTDPAYITGPGMGFGGNLGGFQYDKDYIMLLSEIDARGHASEEGTYGGELVPAASWDVFPYNWALYQPQYWFINGLSFPVTIHAGFPSGYNFADWLLAHPGYDPLITGSVSAMNSFWKTPGEKVLIRVINMGFETQPMHMHGYHGKIIASDQRSWDWSNKSGNKPLPFGQGLEKNTLTIGSGEVYEWLVDMGQQAFQSTYPPGTQTRYYDLNVALCVSDWAAANPGMPPPAAGAPVVNTLISCPAINVYNGGPIVSKIDGLFDPVGTNSQYFPFHNHDDYKATNNGSYPGGMFTMLVPTP